jgi:hypothetical protein
MARKKASGGDLKGFVDSLIGSGKQGGNVPGGVLEVDAYELQKGGSPRRRARKSPPPSAKSVKKSDSKSTKTPKNTKKIAAVTRGGMNVTPLLTALLAIGLRVASGNYFTNSKKNKNTGGCGMKCSKKLKGSGSTLETFVKTLQSGGYNEMLNGSGTPFSFNVSGTNNYAQYDPKKLMASGALNSKFDFENIYQNLASGAPTSGAGQGTTQQYLASQETRPATTTGGARRGKNNSQKSRSKSPSRKPSRGRRMYRWGGVTEVPEATGAQQFLNSSEAQGTHHDNDDKSKDDEQNLNSIPQPGGPPSGGAGKRRGRPSTKSPAVVRKGRSKSPKRSNTKRAKSPVKLPKKATPKKASPARKRGGGNCNREASDLII